MYWEPILFELPQIENHAWYRVVDTARDAPDDILEPGNEQISAGADYLAQGRSVVVFITRHSQETGAEGVAKSGRERSVK
jgi:glycogen operon protein